jgi:hypothetical protein
MLNQLHQYVGDKVIYNGKHCQLIEILEDKPALVFMCLEQSMSIQGDQHGNAHRRVNETFTIPCLSETHHDLHPVVKHFLPDHIHDPLLEFLVKEFTHS